MKPRNHNNHPPGLAGVATLLLVVAVLLLSILFRR
jgi:hypothetical protein